MPLLQTLQHKASRSRLRKLSNKSSGGGDANATVTARTAPSERTDGGGGGDDAFPPPEVLSPQLANNSPNTPSTPSLKFWRKLAPSPSPDTTYSPFLPSVDRQKSTKSILRRRPESRSGSEDEHEVAKVTFGGNGAGRSPRPNNQQLYYPPPSAFSSSQRRPDSTASSSSSAAAPTPPLPTPSPSLSARSGRSPGPRNSSLPPSPALVPGGSSPVAGSYFPPGSYYVPGTPSNSGNNALSPQAALPSTPMSQSRASSVNSRSSNTPGESSTPSSYMSAKSGASSRLSTASTSSAATVSPGRSFPGAVPESPADAACRPYTPSGPGARASARTLSYRSSRPTSSASASTTSTVRAPVQPQSRPASAMSNASSSRRRVSSRPTTRSTRSTRASIASISTFNSMSSHGHGRNGMTSPGPISPLSPGSSGQGFQPYAGSSSSHGGHSPVHNGSHAFVFPPAQRASGRQSTTPTPATPPGQNSSLLPSAAFADDVPMFNVIPATPQKAAEEDAEVEPQSGHRRSSSSHGRRSASMERTLEDMPEVDEEEEEREEHLAGRRLDFDMDEFSRPSPKLQDGANVGVGSPIKLNTLSLDDVESDAESDEAHTAEESPTLQVGRSQDDSANSALQSVPAPPPRFPKSPKRLTQSLYQAHDDGRSISQSLAELAALACDLPPLGEDMAMTANAAAQRLAHARAAMDASEPTIDFTSPRPVSASPVLVGNYHPSVRKAYSNSPPRGPIPFGHGEEESLSSPEPPRRQTMAAPPRGPLPPTPPFSSYPSLPSLVSHGSMPSSASGCTSSSYSQSSMTSSPESDRKMDALFDNLSIEDNGAGMGDLPDNPGIGLGLGLGLGMDMSFKTTESKGAPEIAVSPADDDNVPDEVHVVRPHRMSAMSAHPHRVALYGTPKLGRIRERDSYCSVASTVRHTPHGSMSSLSMMSEMSDDEALSAQVVDITTFAHPYVVGREDARSHEVGVAF